MTGKQPFSRETTVQTAPALLADDPPAIPAGVKIPAPLRWTIDRCMAKDPQQRFYGAGDKLCYKYYYMDTTIRNLDERIYRALRARAVLQGRNVGELLNEAIGGYLARFAVSQGRSTLRDLKPEPFSEGNDFLSQEIDAIVYRERRQ